MEHERDANTDDKWWVRNDPRTLDQEAGRVRTRRTNRDHPNYSIVLIGQNTEKSPGDLTRLVVPRTPAKDHQPTFVWKNTIIIIIMIMKNKRVEFNSDKQYKIESVRLLGLDGRFPSRNRIYQKYRR